MKKILVVDDDYDLRALLRSVLNRAGYEVVEAENGIVALEKAASVEPDLVTLDINMPQMDGFRVCKALKEKESTRRIPVLMMTARAERVAIELSASAGADDYAIKPITNEDFLLRARTLLALGEEARSSSEAVVSPLAQWFVSRQPGLIMIAGGAGGVRAMELLAGAFRRPPAAPVVALLAIPEFAVRLHANQYQRASKLPFVAGTEGAVLAPGTCTLMAAAGRKLVPAVSTGGALELRGATAAQEDALESVERASGLADEGRADLLFSAGAEALKGDVIGILLSGIGNEGIRGLMRLRALGGEAYGLSGTSVAAGSPKRALERGAVEALLTPSEIGEALSGPESAAAIADSKE